MKKQYNSWDEHMGQRLQQLKGEPSFDAWDRIEAELDEKPRRNWLLIAAVFALLAMPASFYVWQTQQQNSPEVGIASTGEYRTARPAEQVAASPATTSENNTTPETARSTEKQSPAYALEQARQPVHSPSAEEQAAAAGQSAPSAGYAAATSPSNASADLSSSREKEHIPARKEITTRSTVIRGTGQAAGTGIAGLSGSSTRTKLAKASAPEAQQHLFAINEEKAANAPAAAGQLPVLAAKTPAAFGLHYSLDLPRLQRQYQAIPRALVASRQNKKDSGTSLWTELMPTWSYRRIEPNASDAVVITAMESQPALSGSRFGAQAAMGVSLPVQKNLEWKTGAFYGIQQQQWSYTYRNAQADSYMTTQTEAGNYSLVPQFTPRTQEINETLHNLGLTTGFSYQLPTKFAENNLDARLLTFYNSTQKLSSFVTLGYSIGIPLSEAVGLHVGPHVQFHVHSSETLSPHFQEKPFVFGIQLGASMDK